MFEMVYQRRTVGINMKHRRNTNISPIWDFFTGKELEKIAKIGLWRQAEVVEGPGIEKETDEIITIQE